MASLDSSVAHLLTGTLYETYITPSFLVEEDVGSSALYLAVVPAHPFLLLHPQE